MSDALKGVNPNTDILIRDLPSASIDQIKDYIEVFLGTKGIGKSSILAKFPLKSPAGWLVRLSSADLPSKAIKAKAKNKFFYTDPPYNRSKHFVKVDACEEKGRYVARYPESAPDLTTLSSTGASGSGTSGPSTQSASNGSSLGDGSKASISTLAQSLQNTSLSGSRPSDPPEQQYEDSQGTNIIRVETSSGVVLTQGALHDIFCTTVTGKGRLSTSAFDSALVAYPKVQPPLFQLSSVAKASEAIRIYHGFSVLGLGQLDITPVFQDTPIARPTSGAARQPSAAQHLQTSASAARGTPASTRSPGSASTAPSASGPSLNNMTLRQPVFGTVNKSARMPPVQTTKLTPGEVSDPKQVVTNYVRVQKYPSLLYEYKVTLAPLEVRNDKGELEDREIKQRSVKQRVFAAFGELPAVAGIKWATDYVTLWSLKEFDLVSAAVGGAFDTGPFQFKRQDGVLTDIRYIKLECLRRLDLSGQLSGHLRHDNYECIVNGLNALMTKKITESQNNTTMYINKDAKYIMHQVGPNKFFTNIDFFPIRWLKAMRGFFTSIRPGQNDLLFNVNTATSAFLPAVPLSDLYEQLNPKENFNNDKKHKEGMKRLRKVLTNVQVRLVYDRPARENKTPNAEPHRRKFITEFSDDPLDEQYYTTEDDPENFHPTVDFYQDILGTADRDQFGHQHCVNVGSKLRPIKDDDGNVLRDDEGYIRYHNYHKAIWVPCHLVEVVPFQPYKGKLNSVETNMMADGACERPHIGRGRIETHGFDILGLRNRTYFDNLNIKVDDQLLKIDVRYDDPPDIQYKFTSKSPELASWDMKGDKFITAVRITNAVIVRFTDCSKKDLATFEQNFGKALRNQGIPYGNLSICDNIVKDHSVNGLTTALAPFCRGENAIIAVLPDKEDNTECYARIKYVTDRVSPVASTCVQVGKVTGVDKKQRSKPNVQYCANVIIKLCYRMGGLPYTLKDGFAALRSKNVSSHTNLADNVLVLGADVALPGVGGFEGRPSVAAVVGNIDGNFMTFPGEMRLIPGRQEVLAHDTMAEMVAHCIRRWVFSNPSRRLPEHILFYRDGISESQYNECHGHEVRAVHSTWDMVRKRYTNGADKDPAFIAANKDVEKPRITFIIVAKRHHTRFFPTSWEDTVIGHPPVEKWEQKDPQTNLKPGLIVDTEVIMPHLSNFYLQSHDAIKSTARAAHYVVLEDGESFSFAEIQKTTHELCYAFPRATKGVSYCGPAYCADRLADRGSKYLAAWPDLDGYVEDLIKRNILGCGKPATPMTKIQRDRWLASIATALKQNTPNWLLPATTRAGANPWSRRFAERMFYL